MRVDIRDPAILAAISPLDLAAYLRSTGWKQVGGSGAPMSVWQARRQGGEAIEVGLPLHQDWSDYHRQIAPLLAELARVEGRSQISIVRDINAVSDDVVRLRAVVAGETAPDGSIAWADGIRLPECADRILTAAARAAFEPRRAYYAKKPEEVTSYMAGLRLGQTEQSSYVITILSRVRPVLVEAQGSLFPDDPSFTESHGEPFERRVTKTLASALTAARSAAERTMLDGRDAFEDAVSKGVSADLCEGLAVLTEAPTLTHVSFRIGWSPARPAIATPPAEVTFARDALVVIRDAGRRLRNKTPVEGYGLTGVVVGLSRPEDALSGVAVIYCHVDNRPHRVAVELSGAAWKLAYASMGVPGVRARSTVRCDGTLIRAAHPFRLEGARDFREVPEDVEEPA